MELITINPNNEQYYSDDFIKGFKCGAERQFEADKKEINIAFQHGLEEGVARTLCADRPQGYWIKVYIATYRCSKCGKTQIADDENELNYCCCCGSHNKIRKVIGDHNE